MQFFVVRSSGFISYGLINLSASSELYKLLASTKACGKEFSLLNSMLPEKAIPFLISLSLVPVDLIKMLKPTMSKASKATLVPDRVHCSGVASRYKYNNMLLHTHAEIKKKREAYFAEITNVRRHKAGI